MGSYGGGGLGEDCGAIHEAEGEKYPGGALAAFLEQNGLYLVPEALPITNPLSPGLSIIAYRVAGKIRPRS